MGKDKTMKEKTGVFFRKLLISVLLIILMVMAGFSLVFLTYALPESKAYKEHKTQSVETLMEEGSYPQLLSWCLSNLDNFSDSMIIQELNYSGSDSVLEKSVMNYYFADADGNPWGALSAEGDGADVAGTELKASSRYWNGYLLFVKILLYFWNLKGIRVFNYILQFVICCANVLLLFRKSRGTAYAYGLSVLLMNPVVIGYNMFFSIIYYIVNFTVLTILCSKIDIEWDKLSFFFVIVGGLTSYLDMLSYPLLTYLFPMAILCFLSGAGCTEKKKCCLIVENAIFWGIGYLGVWVGKWLWGSFITGNDLFGDAIGKILLRTSHDVKGDGVSMPEMFAKLIFDFAKNPVMILAIAAVIVFLVKLLKRKQFKKDMKLFVPYLLMILMSVCWLAVKANHTYIHRWFVYRELAAWSLCGIGMLAVCALRENQNIGKNSNRGHKR